jgi:predicted PurR-regulated permease PerM
VSESARPQVPASPPAEQRAETSEDDHKWVTRSIYTFLFAAAALIVAWWILIRVRGLLIILLVAFFASFALEPAVAWLAKRGWKRGLATGFVLFMGLVLGLLFMISIGSLVASQVADLVERGPRLLNEATNWVNKTFGTDLNTTSLSEAITGADDTVRQAATNIGKSALSVTASLVGVIFQMFTIGLFAFYLTADGPRVRSTICSYLPPKHQKMVLDLWEVAIDKTGGYLYSRALLATLSAVFMIGFLIIIDVPYPVALGVWLGVTSQFIPTVGTYIGGALPVLIALLNSPIDGILVLAYIILYQQFENYVFAPRITARTMSMHPAVAFGGVILGASILGGIGALLALPAVAIIQAIITTYARRHEVIESEWTEESPEPEEKPPKERRVPWRRRTHETT